MVEVYMYNEIYITVHVQELKTPVFPAPLPLPHQSLQNVELFVSLFCAQCITTLEIIVNVVDDYTVVEFSDYPGLLFST